MTLDKLSLLCLNMACVGTIALVGLGALLRMYRRRIIRRRVAQSPPLSAVEGLPDANSRAEKVRSGEEKQSESGRRLYPHAGKRSEAEISFEH
jgi:hypothetical protein